MRAAPPLQVSLHRFGMWRVAIGALALAGLGALTAWGLTWDSRPATVAVLLIGLSVVGSAATLLRMRSASLRWDGRCWRLDSSSAAPTDEAPMGELQVVLDLGPWMLLRFVPAGGQSSSRPSWLPVQRRGLEAQWHALRCAVYGASRLPTVGDEARN